MTDTKPTIEEQISALRTGGIINRHAILASLEKLAALEGQPVPVEPDVVKRIRIAGQSDTLLSVIEYIDALKAKLQAAQQELLDTTWQDHADHWKKRAEQAEKDRDACYASLEATRSKLHEITAFVNDNASLEKLQSSESKPGPVEPFRRFRGVLKPVDRGMWVNGPCDYYHDAEVDTRIDALQSALRVAQQERDRHMGAVKAYIEDAEAMKKRAEQAEKDRDICYISLQDMRRRLHEIASLVTDQRLDEKHTA